MKTGRQMLERAGWFPGRSVDPRVYTDFLRRSGNPVHATVIEFLSEYGGLRVRYPHPAMPSKIDVLQIDPIAASKIFAIEGDGLADYDELTRTPLCTIGLAARGNMILLMNSAGQVYAATGDLLFFVGDSGREAFEALCTTVKLPKVRPRG